MKAKIVVIHEDERCSVSAVYYHDRFVYTVTKYFDEEGNLKNWIFVYADGYVCETNE